MSEEEQELVQQLKSLKGEEAFRKIFERENVRCLRIVSRFIFDHEEAKDVVQESLLKLWKNKDKIEESQGYSKWLYRTLINASFDALRKNQNNPVIVLGSPKEEKTAIEKDEWKQSYSQFQENREKENLQEILQSALDKLDEKYRTVLVLRFWEKMSYKEIAQLLKIPLGTAGRRYVVGLEKLEKILGYSTNQK